MCTVTNYFIVNLALSDLCTAAFNTALQLRLRQPQHMALRPRLLLLPEPLPHHGRLCQYLLHDSHCC